MPARRTNYLADVLALIAAFNEFSNGVRRSWIARRAQACVNNCVTRQAADRARAAFLAEGFPTSLPSKWIERDAALARFAGPEMEFLRQRIREAGSYAPFEPELLPAAMIATATKWARGEGHTTPAMLAARFDKAAKKWAARERLNTTWLAGGVLLWRNGTALANRGKTHVYVGRT